LAALLVEQTLARLFYSSIRSLVKPDDVKPDDVKPDDVKTAAARDINAALEAGWSGFTIGERIPLSEIARARELAEHPVRPG
jgi:hypothetical protein